MMHDRLVKYILGSCAEEAVGTGELDTSFDETHSD